MGAKFASSMANLFMAKWEEDVVYHESRSELVLWKRYIDDILLLWDGSLESHNEFITGLNTNNRGILLTQEASSVEIHFLDLRIRVIEGRIMTSTYFKETDRNGFIHTKSCHHQAWLESIPKSQFLRLRRNCTNVDDFDREASILRGRFLEKGYSANQLDAALGLARTKNRDDLLVVRPKIQDDSFKFSFVTGYSNHHHDIKKKYRNIGKSYEVIRFWVLLYPSYHR